MFGEAPEQSWIPGTFAVGLFFSARDTPRLVYNISEGRRKKPEGTTEFLKGVGNQMMYFSFGTRVLASTEKA